MPGKLSGGTTTVSGNADDSSQGSLENMLQLEGAETVLTELSDYPADGGKQRDIPWIWIISLAVLIGILAAVLAYLALKKKKRGRKPSESAPGEESRPDIQVHTSVITQEFCRAVPSAAAVGKVHHIGRRQAQQDSMGVTAYERGVLAVVADGMGGLADGDKVSQKIVLTMLQDSASLTENNAEGALYRMLAHANREVNSMLGMAERYKSGSTVVAVMVEADRFQWISVGDSRIYLYRGHHLFQVNREHIHEADLWKKAVNGVLSFSEITGDPQRKNVSSFIGMGELRHVDGSIRPVPIYPGDKLLLMSDGVFNTLSEQEICDVLLREGEARRAARALESLVLEHQNPRQDNFTAVILDI